MTTSIRFLLSLTAVGALLTAAGCGDGASTSVDDAATPADSAPSDDSGIVDAVADSEASDAGNRTGELPGVADAAAGDSGTMPLPDSSRGPDSTPTADTTGCSEAGCACTQNTDCNTGLCIEVGAKKQCAATCAGSCAEGFQCIQVQGGGGDVVNACVPAAPRLCEPCNADSDCSNVLGGAASRCVPYTAPGGSLLGHFCAISCGNAGACPSGYACQDTTSIGGATSKQCVRQDLTCPCDERAVQLGLSTACSNASSVGTCQGKRSCSVAGLGACSAAAAQAEQCNLKDDDCDGQTDEPTAGMCDDQNPCSYDNCVGGAECQHPPKIGACDDGSACTTGDACSDGKCVGKDSGCDDGNPCTKDSCDVQKGCVAAADDGASCSDGNACTVGDGCGGGACLPGEATVCDDQNPCTTDSCSPKKGCVFTANSASCSDGNVCTPLDVCAMGACVGTGQLQCNDGNPCTTDACDAKTGCSHSANSLPCNDKNACTEGDMCSDGACEPGTVKPCSDGNACTDDGCDPKKGCTVVANSAPCNDKNACTEGDACKDGACQGGEPKNCDDGNVCTTELCDAVKGCVAISNAEKCSDGNVCTEGDSCSGGKCLGTKLKGCDDGNPCTLDGCDPNDGCITQPKNGACDDGNLCTTGDVCNNQACVPSGILACNDGNPCTNDGCDGATGCFAVNNAAPCSDGNVCTVEDACQSGNCIPGVVKNCDDGNLCTSDLCNPKLGCSSQNNSAPCSDGSVCTMVDTCQGGACVAGSILPCNDGNPCTDDSCDAVKGCLFTANAAPCDDGNGCTSGETCAAGKCSSGKGCAVNAQCTSGQSSVACKCNAGYSGDGFTCSDIDECSNGTANCGANTVCENTPGSFVCKCASNFADCNNNIGDGCEVNLKSSASHCGACGKACSANGVSSPTCNAGVCDGACSPGMADCNGNKQTDGCEVNIKGSDANNCGGCGTVCSGNNVAKVCSAGVCNGTCNAGFGDCNGNKQTDGCEVNTSDNDPNNCGSCGNVCPSVNGAQLTCSGGYCSGGYAVAKLSSGNKQLAFVYAAVGTTLSNDAEYASFCKVRGFEPNLNSNGTYSSKPGQVYSASTYYCNSYCCYLGSGNNQWQNASGFQNFGLPLNVNLRVFDRGCADYQGSYMSGMNTTDALFVSGPNSLTYKPNHFGGNSNYGTSKSLAFGEQGVVLCQMK